MRVLSLPKSLPSDDDFSQLVERYKAFRLLSLQLSPTAFGSTYEREVAFTTDTWVARLQGPLSTNIVAVTGPSVADASTNGVTSSLFDEEWQASLFLRGPFDRDATVVEFDGMFMEGPSRLLDDDIEIYFALYGMYVLPTARGAGYGTAIVEYAKQEAKKLANGARARVILMLDFDNEAAQRTYEKCGFTMRFDYWFDHRHEGKAIKKHASTMSVDV